MQFIGLFVLVQLIAAIPLPQHDIIPAEVRHQSEIQAPLLKRSPNVETNRRSLKSFWHGVETKFQNFEQSAQHDFAKFVNFTKFVVKDVEASAGTFVKEIPKAAVGVGEIISGNVVGGAAELGGAIVVSGAELVKDTTQAVEQTKQASGETISPAEQAKAQNIEGVAQNVGAIANGVSDIIGGNVAQGVGETTSAIVGAVTNGNATDIQQATNIVSSVSGAINPLIQGITSLINGDIGGLAQVASAGGSIAKSVIPVIVAHTQGSAAASLAQSIVGKIAPTLGTLVTAGEGLAKGDVTQLLPLIEAGVQDAGAVVPVIIGNTNGAAAGDLAQKIADQLTSSVGTLAAASQGIASGNTSAILSLVQAVVNNVASVTPAVIAAIDGQNSTQAKAAAGIIPALANSIPNIANAIADIENGNMTTGFSQIAQSVVGIAGQIAPQVIGLSLGQASGDQAASVIQSISGNLGQIIHAAQSFAGGNMSEIPQLVQAATADVSTISQAILAHYNSTDSKVVGSIIPALANSLPTLLQGIQLVNTNSTNGLALIAQTIANLAKTVAPAVAGIAANGQATQIVGQIANVAGDVAQAQAGNWIPLVKDIAGAASVIVPTLISNSTSQGANGANAQGGNIAPQIAAALPQIAQAIQTISAGGEGIPQIAQTVLGLASQIVPSIVSANGSGQAGQVASQITGSLESVIAQVQQVVAGNKTTVSQLLQSGAQDVPAIAQAILSNVDPTLAQQVSAVAPLVAQTLPTLLQSVHDISNGNSTTGISGLIGIVAHLCSSVAPGVGQAVGQVVSGVQAVVDGAQAGDAQGVASAAQGGADVTAAIVNATDNSAAGQQAGQDIQQIAYDAPAPAQITGTVATGDVEGVISEEASVAPQVVGDVAMPETQPQVQEGAVDLTPAAQAIEGIIDGTSADPVAAVQGIAEAAQVVSPSDAQAVGAAEAAQVAQVIDANVAPSSMDMSEGQHNAIVEMGQSAVNIITSLRQMHGVDSPIANQLEELIPDLLTFAMSTVN